MRAIRTWALLFEVRGIGARAGFRGPRIGVRGPDGGISATLLPDKSATLTADKSAALGQASRGVTNIVNRIRQASRTVTYHRHTGLDPVSRILSKPGLRGRTAQ